VRTQISVKNAKIAIIAATGLLLSACMTPRYGLDRPASIERMQTETFQGVRYWQPVSLSLETATTTASASFYDYSTLRYDRGGRGAWYPYSSDGTVYRKDTRIMLPFISSQRFPARKAYFDTVQGTSRYNLALDIPVRTYYDGEYVIIRTTDGAFDPGLDGTHKIAIDPWVPDDHVTTTGIWYAHQGIEALPESPDIRRRIEGEIALRGFSPVRFRTLYQSRNTWEGIDLQSGIWLGWRRSQEKLEVLFFRFDSDRLLVETLRQQTDALGFDITAGKNRPGWYADGRHEDGRRFDGVIDGNGRQGYGTTIFSDDTAVVGTYEDDALNGFAISLQQGLPTAIGNWTSDEKDGLHILLDRNLQPLERELWSRGVRVESGPYRSGPLPDEWYWFGERSQPVAVSRDFSARIIRYIRESDYQEYTIQREDGRTVNVIESPDETRGIIRYNDGKVYEGRLVSMQPEGDGQWLFPSGERLRGTFINGVPDGEMIRESNDGVRRVVRYEMGKRLLEAGEYPERETSGPDDDSMEQLFRQLSENTQFLIESIRDIRAEVARRQAADRAAMLYEFTDSLQRELAVQGQSNQDIAALNEFLQETGILESVRESALERAQGSQMLAEYQFRRALETALVEQDFRELKNIIVANLREDERYTAFADFLDVAGEVAQTSWDVAKEARKLNAEARTAVQSQQGGATAAVNPKPAWPNRGRPSYDENSVHLRAMVLTADENYRGYVTLLQQGEQSEAERYYEAHLLGERNAYDFIEMTTM
jgi:hypothetical protein